MLNLNPLALTLGQGLKAAGPTSHGRSGRAVSRRRQRYVPPLAVEPLEIRQLMTLLPEAGETIGTAMPIAVPPSSNLSILLPTYYEQSLDDGPDGSDVDVYSFTGYAGFEFRARTLNLDSSLDTVLTLFDVDGNVLVQDDNSGYDGANAELSFTFAETATYYLAVSGAPDDAFDPIEGSSGVGVSTGGNYQLEVSLSISEQELILGPDQFASGLAGLDPAETVSYFFVAPQSGTFTILAEAYPQVPVQLMVEVFDDNHNFVPLSDQDASPGVSVQILSAAAGQVFHINLRNNDSGEEAFALLQISTDYTPASDVVGDTDETATELFYGGMGQLESSGTIEFAGDVDVYKFVAPVTGTYSWIFGSADGVDVEVDFFRPSDGTTLPSLEPETFGSLFRNLVAGEVVYARVRSFSQSRGLYNVTLSVEPAINVALDANDRVRIVDSRPDGDVQYKTYTFVAPAAGIVTLTNVGTYHFFHVSIPSPTTASILEGYERRVVAAGEQVFISSAPDFSFMSVVFDDLIQFDPLVPLTLNASDLVTTQDSLADDLDTDAFTLTATRDGFLSIRAEAAYDVRLQVEVGSVSGSYVYDDDNFVHVFVYAGDQVIITTSGVEGGTGSYSLSAQISEEPDDFGNTFEQAQYLLPELPPPSEGQGPPRQGNGQEIPPPPPVQFYQFGTLETTLDVDVFEIVPEVTGTFRVNVSAYAFVGSTVDPIVAIYDSERQLIAFNDDSETGTNALLAFVAEAGRSYYVEVRAGYPTRGEYLLDVALVVDDVVADIPLPGTPDTTLNYTGTVDFPLDTDTFSITATMAGRLTLQLDADPGSLLNPFLTVLSSTGDVLASDDDSGTGISSLVSLVVAADQQVFVRASSFGQSAGGYTLTYLLDTSSATPTTVTLSPGATTTLTRSIEQPFSTDQYKITAPGAGTIQITQSATAGSTVNPLLGVFLNGTFYGADDDSGDGLDAFLIVPVAAGDQVVIQAGAYSNTSGGYTIAFRFDPGQPEDDVPFDAVETVQVSLERERTQSGRIERSKDTDLYKLTVPSDAPPGSLLQVRSVANDPSLDPIVEVYSGDPRSGGVLIGYSDNDGVSFNSNAIVPVTANQEIYVRASGFGTTTGGYTLVFRFVTDDFVNTITSAGITDLTPGADGTVSVDGAINVASDVDVFHFKSTTSAVVRFRLNVGTPGTLDPTLQIYNSLGQLIAFNDDSNGSLNSLIELEYVGGTDLYVVAAGFGSSIGNYTVAVELIFGTQDDVGNSFSTASTVSVVDGQSVIERLLDSSTDVDFFRFVAPGNGTVQVSLSGISGAGFTVFERVGTAGVSSQQLPQQIARGNAASPATITIKAGLEYYVKISGDRPGAYRLQLDFTETETTNFLSDEEFSALVTKARIAFATNGGNLDQTLEEVLRQFRFLTTGRNTEGTLIAIVDPVDFLISPNGQTQNVGFATNAGRVVEVAQARLSQDDTLELLVLPSTSQNFNLQLQGVGGDFRIAARLLTQQGDLAPLSLNGTSGSLAKNSVLQVVLDFAQRTTPSTSPPPGLPGSASPQALASTGFSSSLISFGSAVQVLTAVGLLVGGGGETVTQSTVKPTERSTKTSDNSKSADTSTPKDASGKPVAPNGPKALFAVLSAAVKSLFPQFSLGDPDSGMPGEESANGGFGGVWGLFSDFTQFWTQPQPANGNVPQGQAPNHVDPNDLPPPIPFPDEAPAPGGDEQGQAGETPTPVAIDAAMADYAA